MHATALEYLGGGLAWVGYWSLWVLLAISAFRPETRFYLSGDCLLRAKRFGLILGILVLVHVWFVVAVFIAFRGGFR